MTAESEKDIHSTKCKKCGAVVDITMTAAMRKIIAQNKALKEELTETSESIRNIRAKKHGELQKLHHKIRLLLDMLPADKRLEGVKIVRKNH